MNEMFETNKLLVEINTFQSLLRKNGTKHDHKMEQCLNQMLRFLNDFNNLQHALDSSVIVAATDTRGKILFANDKFCKISKYSRDELIGNSHRILNSGYHDKAFFKQMWDTIIRGDIWEGELRNKAKDGSIYWVKTTIVPLKNEKEEPVMFMTIRTNITQGKLAQEELVKALQNDFRFVVNSMHNLIFKVAKDQNNQFIYILNEGKLAYQLGLEKEKMINKTPKEVFPEELASTLEMQYAQAFTGKDITYHYSYEGKQLLTYLSPIFRDGKVIEVIGCINDITDLHCAQEKVKFMAFHDNLTNLPNRRKFNEDIKHYISNAQNQNHKLAIFFLDLDRFKQINDSFGHNAGDHLIKEVATRLKKAVGSNGIVYRLAGDEFLIIYPNIESNEVITYYANQISTFSESVFILPNKLEIYTSSSIGISIFPDHGEDSDTLLKNADTAMYNSKSNNRKTFCIYQQEMNQHFEEALLIEHQLHRAIEHNELELYYQPKLDLYSNKINGIEALLRWDNPFLGKVSPNKFIPIAEDTGQILLIDEWVLETACQQNKEWNNHVFSTPIKVSVNISSQHFRIPNFDKVVERVLEKTGLDPKLLEIEITEHSFIHNTQECITCLQKLNDMGVSIAIDDFGMGYSSLNYLRKFPIHSLKIDRSFIQELSENHEDNAIVKAITFLAHELNLKVVAEGIEENRVIEVLKKLGCDEIQGFFISEPLPYKEFEEFFRKTNNHLCLV